MFAHVLSTAKARPLILTDVHCLSAHHVGHGGLLVRRVKARRFTLRPCKVRPSAEAQPRRLVAKRVSVGARYADATLLALKEVTGRH